MAIQVLVKNVRIAFPTLWEPTQFNGQGDYKFEVTALIDKTRTEVFEDIENAIKKVAIKKWGVKDADKIIKSIRNIPNRFCLRDGDEKEYDGYAGNMFIKASSTARPTVVDRDRTSLTAQDGRPYSGCYCNVSLEFFAYDNSGKGISAKLRGVQFLRDGDAFAGGGVASADEFEDLSVAEDEESLI